MRVMEALTLSRLRPIGCAVLFAALLSHAAPPSFAERVQLIPHFRAGQILFYRIDFSSALNAKTQSRVTSPQLPPTSNANASGLLQVEIAEATSSSLRKKHFILSAIHRPHLHNRRRLRRHKTAQLPLRESWKYPSRPTVRHPESSD